MPAQERIFLTAEWRDLLMLNYEVGPDLLRQYVPHGTELDSFQGKSYLSLVGFRFCHTRLRGRLAIPSIPISRRSIYVSMFAAP